MADVSDPAIVEAYNDVKSDQTDTRWTLLGYQGNTNKVVVQAKGSGGLAELVDNLQEDQSQYGYIRVTSGDEESKRTKFAFISWCGENVGALKRAKMSVHKANVKGILNNFAIEVHATLKSELDEDDLMAKIRKAGGADYSGNTSTR